MDCVVESRLGAWPRDADSKEIVVGPEFRIGHRIIGVGHPPLVIAEIGINHEGDYAKAIRMVDDAHAAGCECVKFQCHVVDDEMIPNDVVPGNTTETIWDIMVRCALSEDEERRLKSYVEAKGMIYLCTPFSRAAVLEKHFTSDKTWPGPDVPISIDPTELSALVFGSRAIHAALGGAKTILPEEQPTIDFAYACVVTTDEVAAGERLTSENVWVKRPGTGEIRAVDYERVLGRTARRPLAKNTQVRWSDLA